MKEYLKIQPIIIVGAAMISTMLLGINQLTLNVVGVVFSVGDLIIMSILSTVSLTVACNVVIGLTSIIEKWR